MRLRQRTRSRILLAAALAAPLVWTTISSIPSRDGGWPWPPGSPESWSVIDLPSHGTYRRNDRNGVMIQFEKHEGLAIQEYREKAQTAWLIRVFICVAGLFGSFLAVIALGGVAAYVTTRFVAKGRPRPN